MSKVSSMFTFGMNPCNDGTKLARTPNEAWTARPPGAAKIPPEAPPETKGFLVIGVFGNEKIQYVKGNQPDQLKDTLTALAS
jgi:hypothetical protein